jgi:hypothetical protein
VSVPYSALIDASTFALLALSQYPYIVSFLAKSRPLEAEQVHGVNWPNYRTNFTLADEHPRAYPSWSWDMDRRRFEPTANVTDELRARSILAVVKCRTLAEMTYELSVARYPIWRGLLLQEQVYAAKKQQAQAYRDAGYPDDVLAYPYVLQYAEFSGLPLRAAADEILFKAQLDDDALLKTEALRLRYFKLVADAAKAEELVALLRGFREDIYHNAVHVL